jgi:hypothetical protein
MMLSGERDSKLRTATFSEGSVRNACKSLFRRLDPGTTGGVQRKKTDPPSPSVSIQSSEEGFSLSFLGWMDSGLFISLRMPSSSG